MKMLSKLQKKKKKKKETSRYDSEPRRNNSTNRMNYPDESNDNEFREYISDIEDLENEEGAEFDEDELEINAEQTTGFGAWTPVECDPEPMLNHEETLWEAVKNRVIQITRKISHAIWLTNTKGWQHKVSKKEYTWEQIFTLCFPSGMLCMFKLHMIAAKLTINK